MPTMVVGLFSDSKHAGMAISELKEKGYTDEISIVSRGDDGEVQTDKIKSDADATATGALTGAIAGAIAGVAAVALPGGPLLVGGPVALAWGASGAALGALSGGLLGGLVDLGFDESQAELYERRIMAGDIMVSVTGDEDRIARIVDIMNMHHVDEIVQISD